MHKTIIGLVETVDIGGKKFKARIDTGAGRSSLDKEIAEKLNLGPVIKNVKVRSVHGKSERPVIKAQIKLGDQELTATFSLANRNEMERPVLIGRNILKKGFLIDPEL